MIRTPLLNVAAICAFSQILMSGSLHAEDISFVDPNTLATAAPESGIVGNMTLLSDYLFRGETLSDNKPAVQGGIDYFSDNGLFIGIWASSGDKEKPLEIDIYSGLQHDFDDKSAILVELRGYLYPHDDNADTIEASIAGLLYDTRLQYYYDFELEQHYIEAAYQYSVSKVLGGSLRVGLLSKDNVPASMNKDLWDIELNADYSLSGNTTLQGKLAYHEREEAAFAIGITTTFSP